MRILITASALFGWAALSVTAKGAPLVDAENARYKAELDAGIAKLNTVHVERLTAILSKLTAAGDLDGAVAIRDQIKAIAAAPNSPDSVAISSVALAAKPIPSSKIKNGDLSFLKGDWFLLALDTRFDFSFDEKGNYKSLPWKNGSFKWEGNRLYTQVADGKFFRIIDSNTLEGVSDKGSKTGEMFIRKTAENSSK